MRRLLAAIAACLVALGVVLTPPASAEPTPPLYPTPAGEFEVRSGNGVVRVRAEPSTESEVVDKLPSGTTVTVLCSKTDGSPVRTRTGKVSTVWNRVEGGAWISDVLTVTGTFEPQGPDCATFDRQMSKANEQADDIALMNEMSRKNREDPVTCYGHRHQGAYRTNPPYVLFDKQYTAWKEIWSQQMNDEAQDRLVEQMKKRSKELAKLLKRGFLIDGIDQRTRTEGYRLEWCGEGGMWTRPFVDETTEYRVRLLGLPMDGIDQGVKDRLLNGKPDPLSVPLPIELELGGTSRELPIQPLTAEMDRQAIGCMPHSISCFEPGVNTAPSHPGAQPPPRHPR